ncbi:MAG: hypothetical protein N2557_04340, partial [Hydrogenophilus sp.]|nr:hypothetical protein [Hydrogenophilus sp.]
PTLTQLFSGIALDVTPRIDGDTILLHVRPTVTEIIEKPKSFTLGTNYALPLPVTRVRETDTVVRAKNGQIIVIGGLMQDTGEARDASLPLLGDLPLLGELFKHRRNSARKSELVILMRPILANDESLDEELAAARQRLLAATTPPQNPLHLHR